MSFSRRPAIGASLTFTASGTNTATVNTNASGIAVAPQANANSIAGTYFVTATATGTSVSTAILTQNIPQPRFMIEISPQGPAVIVDGASYNGQFNYFNWTAGRYPHRFRQLTATGYCQSQNVFTGWSDGGSPTHTITVPQGVAFIKASFKQQVLVTFTTAGGTISPATGYFDPGPVVVTATANPGYAFSGWEGPLQGTASQQTLNLTHAVSVIADFTSNSPFSRHLSHVAARLRWARAARLIRSRCTTPPGHRQPARLPLQSICRADWRWSLCPDRLGLRGNRL